MEEKKLSLYDSSQQYTTKHHDTMLKNILDFLKFESETKKQESLNEEEWSSSVEDCPQQKNNYDCGYYMCQIFRSVAKQQELDFNQDHFAYFKKLMCYEFSTASLQI